MIAITYGQMLLVLTAAWLCVRAVCWMRSRRVDWKREAQLLLVYVCLAVAMRFTFCPFGRVNGEIQPLLLDPARLFPPTLNLLPFVYWFDYPELRDALLNLIGNTLLFLPMGIVWPAVFRGLCTHGRAIAAGAGLSLCIELLQLPFFERTTDIDDLLLNTVGYLMGYGILCLCRALRARIRAKKGEATA